MKWIARTAFGNLFEFAGDPGECKNWYTNPHTILSESLYPELPPLHKARIETKLVEITDCRPPLVFEWKKHGPAIETLECGEYSAVVFPTAGDDFWSVAFNADRQCLFDSTFDNANIAKQFAEKHIRAKMGR